MVGAMQRNEANVNLNLLASSIPIYNGRWMKALSHLVSQGYFFYLLDVALTCTYCFRGALCCIKGFCCELSLTIGTDSFPD